MTQNSRNFGENKEWENIENNANKLASNPFSSNITGGTAEFSSWGLFHSYSWKLRLALIDSYQNISTQSSDSHLFLRDIATYIEQLNFLFVGIFKNAETEDIETRVDEINKEINAFLIIKSRIKKKPIPSELIQSIRNCYKRLSLYQMQHNLLLPLSPEAGDRLKSIENTLIGN